MVLDNPGCLIGIKGIGLYDSFVHIDTRTAKFFWYGHGQEQRLTFNEATANKELTSQEQNPILKWQLAAIADGFTFASGADGKWGNECAAVAKRAVIKKRANYLYPNLTKIVQKAVGAEIDGKCGDATKTAIKKPINIAKPNNQVDCQIEFLNLFKHSTIFLLSLTFLNKISIFFII